MKTAAIICEYNPLHLGHVKQFAAIRQALGEDCRIVCLMSGRYVQRGEPAIFDPFTRAAAAVQCGADLVLELPLTAALSSAEGFAAGAVDVLTRLGCIDVLCFGCECGSIDALLSTAAVLQAPAFSEALRAQLRSGESFAALRQRAVEALGGNGSVLQRPNDILAVEYCKALGISQSTITPMAIQRQGSYHAPCPDAENPSATALRILMPDPRWLDYVPQAAKACFREAPLHRLQWGERAILARLRAMQEDEFAALPYGSEGLWRKLMAQSYEAATLDALIDGVKSRRYARARISRMVMCAFLGITATALSATIPYVRILAFSPAGRSLLRQAQDHGNIPLLHADQRAQGAYDALEQRAARLYPLFLSPEAAPSIPAPHHIFQTK